MKHNKAIFSMAIISLLIGGCATQSTTNDPSPIKEASEKNVLTVKSSLDVKDDFSNAKELFETSQYVALVHIDEILESDNINYYTNEKVAPYTIGKMTILEMYKGTLEKNRQVTFTKLGGTLPFTKYYEGLSEAQQAKIDEINPDAKESYESVKYALNEDIDIEQGKNYLVYFVDDHYYLTEESYTLYGLQGGLREVKNANEQASKRKVLNNYKNEWELLDEVVLH